MSYLGSWKIGDYVPIPAATHRFSSGAAYAPTAITYSIYEDSDIGSPIDTNVDMVPASPFAGIVGCYYIRRQLTVLAGFEKGKNYLVVIKATVDGVSAIQMHTFQIEAEVDANTVSNAVPKSPATLTPGDCSGALPANLTEMNGVPQSAADLTDFADSGYDPTAHKVQGVVLTDTVTTYTGNTPQTGDVGPNGSLLTAIGDTRMANLDATVGSRSVPGDAMILDPAEVGAGLTALGDTRVANLDAAVSTRAVTGDAMALTVGERTSVADAMLLRDWTAIVAAVPSRCILNALRFLRNKWTVIANLLTVTKEDDATSAWTATVTTDPAAEPVVGSDPL